MIEMVKMNGKMIALVLVLVMVIGSFGAVGTQMETESDCGCGALSREDYKALDDTSEYQTGLVVPDNWWVDAPFDPCEDNSDEELPPIFDWRDKKYNTECRNCVTPVKDQGSCGSCWAFATTAVLESVIKIRETKTVDLSEQWLVS